LGFLDDLLHLLITPERSQALGFVVQNPSKLWKHVENHPEKIVVQWISSPHLNETELVSIP
jgi:hypothetical protein